jgi:hypothetical protein
LALNDAEDRCLNQLNGGNSWQVFDHRPCPSLGGE